AAIDFLHGLAAWDFAEASRAADALLDAARGGDLWLNADMLRDGTVLARLATHDRTGARSAFEALMSKSDRSPTDLRTRLLWAYISDSARTPLSAGHLP